MLGENIKAIRESKGLSQEELAVKLNVVRQTVSKWERGRSVPDADLLVRLSEELGAPVSVLLGEVSVEDAPRFDELRVIAEKLEVVNHQLALKAERGRKTALVSCVAVFVIAVLALTCLAVMGSGYLAWDLSDPEIAVAATVLHGFEWLFIRVLPVLLIASVGGFCLAWRRR